MINKKNILHNYNALKKRHKKQNEFIIDIAKLLNIDTDGVGYDEIQLTIDDIQTAIEKLKH